MLNVLNGIDHTYFAFFFFRALCSVLWVAISTILTVSTNVPVTVEKPKNIFTIESTNWVVVLIKTLLFVWRITPIMRQRPFIKKFCHTDPIKFT